MKGDQKLHIEEFAVILLTDTASSFSILYKMIAVFFISRIRKLLRKGMRDRIIALMMFDLCGTMNRTR